MFDGSPVVVFTTFAWRHYAVALWSERPEIFPDDMIDLVFNQGFFLQSQNTIVIKF